MNQRMTPRELRAAYAALVRKRETLRVDYLTADRRLAVAIGELLRAAVNEHGYRPGELATLLAISRETLHKRLRQYS